MSKEHVPSSQNYIEEKYKALRATKIGLVLHCPWKVVLRTLFAKGLNMTSFAQISAKLVIMTFSKTHWDALGNVFFILFCKKNIVGTHENTI